MKKTTSFAIKANVASYFVLILITIIPAFVLGDTWKMLMSNKFFAGIFSIIITFVSLLLSLKILLKNSQLASDEKKTALLHTWYAYLIITAGFLLLSFQALIAKFGLGYQMLLLIAQAASAYLAIWLAKNFNQNEKTENAHS